MPQLYHHNPITEMANDQEIMADKKESRFLAALTLHQQIRNRRLNRNIQSPNRFISTQNPRATRKSPGALKSADIILILNTTKVVRHQTRRDKSHNLLASSKGWAFTKLPLTRQTKEQ